MALNSPDQVHRYRFGVDLRALARGTTGEAGGYDLARTGQCCDPVTPLGVEIMGDGGLLFTLACGVWISSVAILFIHRNEVIALVQAILSFVRRDKMTAH